MKSRLAWNSLVLAFFHVLTAPVTFAQTVEQIRETCRESVRPQVQSCVQSKIGSMAKEEAFAVCRKAVTGAVQACVARASQRIAAGKPAPAAPKETVTPSGPAAAVPVVFVAPPRTISDITAMLDGERPDPAKLRKLQEAADAAPPPKATPKALAQFYYDRGNARALLARTSDALADGFKALEGSASAIDIKQVTRIRQFIALQQQSAGQTKAAIETVTSIVRDGRKGAAINAHRFLVSLMIASGNIEQADDYARKVAAAVSEARGSPLPNWRSTYAIYGHSWESDADDAKAQVLEMRGKYREAEEAYKRALAFRVASLKDIGKYDFPPPPEQVKLVADRILLSIARIKARQGAFAQAEADARRALLNVLQAQGKYNPATTPFIVGLAEILVEQGRYQEAEKLLRVALDVRRTLSIADDNPGNARILAQLGGVLVLQGKFADAATTYKLLETGIAAWTSGKQPLLLTLSRVTALYAIGEGKIGLATAEELLKRELARVGERHIDTAWARAAVATGYAVTGREAEAVREFKVTVPVLLAAGNEAAGDDDPTVTAARRQRLQAIIETYIDVLLRTQGADPAVAAETLALADAIRGRSVQQALAASSARMIAKDPNLSDLVRSEQDLGKQIGGQLGVLNNALALPASERDEALIRSINATIDRLRGERLKAREQINRRFPEYAALVDPRPPTIDQVKASLKPDEALLSLYFGRTHSFAWAVSPTGLTMARIAVTATELSERVATLRQALQPNAETVDEIPRFDVSLAHELYRDVLAPTAGTWRPAKSLILVTNGDLGLLPLALLPTELPSAPLTSTQMFDGYRTVAWLARTHAVSQIPSVAALRSLRQLPTGSPERSVLIGFGDPFFSPEQAEDATATAVEVASVATRGIPLRRRAAPKTSEVDSAELAQLPRLPDTADELHSIALALSADPAKALFLGKEATERRVKATNLANYKIVAFATHGLVPGELNGLTQPALALSAPDEMDSDGDGLLTMEEILALKMDADWVVLSACNTGTGAGAGAEAASGLGRAFFYAGTRALLVTNWSVHSASARELVSDLFRRQAETATVSRAEALRQAMMAVLDSGGLQDEKGQTVFTYAHPLFWAPYTIIGDGGQG